MNINYSDDFLTEDEHRIIYQYCLGADYKYGEVDAIENNDPPTGMTSDILDTHPVYDILKESIYKKAEPLIDNKFLFRMYVNFFVALEKPYFHTDGDEGCITFLYYPNLYWDINDGGETQFLVDGNIYGVLPIPNRMVIFDASISHRATSFRSSPRFTVAIKYGDK